MVSCQAKAGWKEWCDWQPLRTHARGKGPSYPTWHSGHRCKRVHRIVWFPLEPAIQAEIHNSYLLTFFFHKGLMGWSKNVTRYSMMTSSNEGIFRVSGPLTTTSDAELWCFLWFAPEQTVEQRSRRRWFETPSRSLWRHSNAVPVTRFAEQNSWNWYKIRPSPSCFKWNIDKTHTSWFGSNILQVWGN